MSTSANEASYFPGIMYSKIDIFQSLISIWISAHRSQATNSSVPCNGNGRSIQICSSGYQQPHLCQLQNICNFFHSSVPALTLWSLVSFTVLDWLVQPKPRWLGGNGWLLDGPEEVLQGAVHFTVFSMRWVIMQKAVNNVFVIDRACQCCWHAGAAGICLGLLFK